MFAYCPPQSTSILEVTTSTIACKQADGTHPKMIHCTKQGGVPKLLLHCKKLMAVLTGPWGPEDPGPAMSTLCKAKCATGDLLSLMGAE